MFSATSDIGEVISVESHVYDDLDWKILHALHLDGRVGFSTLADLLGVSGQTVARRFAGLKASGVRVLGRTDPLRTGETSWFVRVRCAPAGAGRIADALARRPDSSWVRATSGGTDIIAVIRAPSRHDAQALLLEQLPRTPQVLDVTANCMLHQFFGGVRSVVDALPTAVADRVRFDVAPQDGTAELDRDDRAIVAVLARDGRTEVSAVAKRTGLAATTIRRRLADLRTSGALYFDVDFDYTQLGIASQTVLWLSVEPHGLRAAGEALARHSEVSFAAATTGATNLYASVLCRDSAELFRYLVTKVAELPAVRAVETAPVIRTYKQL
jgi:DNA-binding Lrp family transcriptional regulator